MQIGVIQFPGSNCERETRCALKRAGMEPLDFLWNEDKAILASLDGFVIVGGFSYEDRSRAGIIAALDPIMLTIREQSELGKPVLGICNGAQILVESGLVPGLSNYRLGLALTENKRVFNHKVVGTGYYNEWVYMRLCEDYQRNAFTKYLSFDTILRVPVAHAQGRFVLTDALWQELSIQGMGLLQYCDAEGQVIDAFPVNPNGSRANLAGVSNKAGNVLALMPHPERTTEGDPIFHSMREYIAEAKVTHVASLSYYPRFPSPFKNNYHKPTVAHEYLIDSIVTDNEALTVHATLKQLGWPVTVKRFVHWKIEYQAGAELPANDASSDHAMPFALKESGVLYHPRKESIVTHALTYNINVLRFLVRAKEDIFSKEKMQILRDQFEINYIAAMQHAILWEITANEGDVHLIAEAILATQILHNPYSHDCYQYD